MCGIVGFTGKKDALPILLDTLSYLEYRGYDSAGIAFFDENGKIGTVKAKGRISNLKSKLRGKNIITTCGIGHTRWATHGVPSDVNAHPHSADSLSIVHNGIIENCSELKAYLKQRGYSFISETDTEVCAKLMDYHYKHCGEPVKAIHLTCSMLCGSYAIGAVFADYPDTVYAFKKDSPLIISPSDIGNFIVSDMSALAKHTKKFYALNDGETAKLTRDKIEFFDSCGMRIYKDECEFHRESETASLGAYPHFMMKEIYEEPTVVKKTAESLIDGDLPKFAMSLDTEKLKAIAAVHIVACGTAYHAGLCGGYVFEKFLKIPVQVHLASEFRYSTPVLGKYDLVVFVSQSGETADTLAAMRLTKSMGIHTLALVNVYASAMALEADDVIYTKAGTEISVASTKAYVAQLAALYVVAVKIAFARGCISRNKADSLLDTILTDIPEKISAVLAVSENCRNTANILKNSRSVFFIGRGVDYAQSREAALKAKEISYIHCEAYAAGELKHGSIALIDKGVPVVAIITCHKTKDKIINNIREVKARGAYVILFVSGDMTVPDDIYDEIIRIPETEEIFMPMVCAPAIQLTAYHMAVSLGYDPDKPRNLAKSVTVE